MKIHRSTSLIAVSASLLALLAGCGQKDESSEGPAAAADSTAASFESIEQQVSYGIAHNMATNIKRQGGLDVDEAAFMAGLQDGLAGKEPVIPEAKLEAAFFEMQNRAQAAAAEAGSANAAEGERFLTANKAKPGVNVTNSGLQYRVISSGDGPKPTASDRVEVHYHGTLMDGTVFDSSVQRGQTAKFPVGGVIPGWTEALQLMSVGDKWELTIPPALAYGNRAAGAIPPGSVLIFEVELIGIQ